MASMLYKYGYRVIFPGQESFLLVEAELGWDPTPNDVEGRT